MQSKRSDTTKYASFQWKNLDTALSIIAPLFEGSLSKQYKQKHIVPPKSNNCMKKSKGVESGKDS